MNTIRKVFFFIASGIGKGKWTRQKAKQRRRRSRRNSRCMRETRVCYIICVLHRIKRTASAAPHRPVRASQRDPTKTAGQRCAIPTVPPKTEETAGCMRGFRPSLFSPYTVPPERVQMQKREQRKIITIPRADSCNDQSRTKKVAEDYSGHRMLASRIPTCLPASPQGGRGGRHWTNGREGPSGVVPLEVDLRTAVEGREG